MGNVILGDYRSQLYISGYRCIFSDYKCVEV